MTETWTRDLFEQAADTVPVGPPPTFHQPRRPHRRWPLLAAAATVALALGAAALVGQLRDQPEEPGGRRVAQLDQFDIPLTFGMTTQQATEVVRDAGFDPVVQATESCEVEGRVLSAHARTDGTAVIQVPDRGMGLCVSDSVQRTLAWELIDLATGRGPGPARTADCCPDAVMRRLARVSTTWAPVDGIFNIPPELVVTPTGAGFELEIGMTVNDRFSAYEQLAVAVQGGMVTDVRPISAATQGTPSEAAVEGTREFVAMVRAGKLWPAGGIDMYVDGERRPDADGNWDVCPSNSALSCYENVLALIRSADGVRQQAAPPDLPCDHPSTLRLYGLTSMTLTPTDNPDVGCATWAIQLWWTDQGELKAVNAVLGEP